MRHRRQRLAALGNHAQDGLKGIGVGGRREGLAGGRRALLGQREAELGTFSPHAINTAAINQAGRGVVEAEKGKFKRGRTGVQRQ